MGIFVITLLVLLSFQFRSEILLDTEEGSIAKIQVKDFIMYQIGQETTDTVIQGDQATQYKDYEVFENASLSRSLEKAVFEKVSAPEVYRKQDLYNFSHGVHYERSDGFKFFSEKGLLDTKNEVFRGSGKFQLESEQGEVLGQDILYNNQTQDIQAKKIQGYYLMKG